MGNGIRALAVLLFVSLGVVVLTGASPIADLISRVEALEGTVEALETENQALSQQVTSLKGQSDQEPVVIDANGLEVGTVVGDSSRKGARVLFDFEGSPLFTLEVFTGHLNGDTGTIAFASSDCSGAPLIEGSSPTHPFPTVFHMTDGSGVTLLSPNPVTERIPVKASMNRAGTCSPWDASVLFAPAIPVPAMEGLFTAPFEVATRGDLPAEE